MQRTLARLERLLPTLVMAAGVGLLTAGVLAYAPSAFGERSTPAADGHADPRLAQPTAGPRGGATAAPIPIGSIAPSTPTPAPGARAFATRIRIPALRIDLAIVPGDLLLAGSPADYPPCDVAMFLPNFAQPGEPGTTYIYAHAQRGMFLPLLRASESADGASLLGGLVEVYTSANELHLYEIVRVKRHATDLSLVTGAGDREQLVLQTSEGPTGTVPKLQVAAEPVGVLRATTSEARPSAQPRVCGPTG